ncbi:MAG: OmpA family protein [Thermodesulfovibrionales bacterium]|nr:OmpA family protein [Thermodesulfovibrionales bacterium]MDP3110833.1 OmpA family protein [Thermodesulfovibrionales bacterium]
MKLARMLSIVLGMLFFAGCVVSQSKYDASLADIANLKKDVSTLEENLKAKEAEKKNLETELSKLREEDANLKQLLDAKKDELTRNVTDLRAKLSEKEGRIKEIENELKAKDMQISELKTAIAGLSQEKSKALEEKEKAIEELKKTYTSLVTELNEEIKKGEIAVTQLRDKLSLSMVDKILFDSGSADVKKDGKKVLDRVAGILKKVADKQIRIEGHTDNVPIGSRIAKKFATNWELSNARATNVVRYLQEKGIDPKLLSPAGYAEYRPVEANETEEGKAKNRRIGIVLIPLDSAL